MGIRHNSGGLHRAERPSIGCLSWCDEALRLIDEGCYERAIELLKEPQAADPTIEHTQYSSILAAAYTICLACEQCRAEAESHRGAIQITEQRERELRGQLIDILRSFLDSPTLENLDLDKSSERVDARINHAKQEIDLLHKPLFETWQRLKVLLGHEKDSQLPSVPLQESLVQTQTM